MSLGSAKLPPRVGVWRRTVQIGLCVVLSGCSLDELSAPVRSNDEVAEDGSWVVLDLQNVLQRRAQSGLSFYPALAGAGSFEVGVLRRHAAAVDRSYEHPYNTLYRVLTGSGSMVTSGDTVPFEPGHLLFVREGVGHRLERSSSVVDLLVVFALGPASALDPEFKVFSGEEIVAGRDGERNVFNDLVDASGMAVGMYMIPKNGDDPSVLEHRYDELKVVVEGGGRFDIGSGGLEAEAGTIAYLTSGTSHQFRRASDALDVIVIRAN